MDKANESTKDVDKCKPAKRRKTSECKKAKGKKVSILCVTEPYLPGSTLDKQSITPADVDADADAALLASPLIPTHGIQQDSAASDLMKQVLEKVETLQMVLQGVESFVSEQIAALQVLQLDVHGAKLLELQNKLDNLECTAAAVKTSQQISHLSPATDHHQREILQDVTNVLVQSSALQICNTPAHAQSQLKSAADVIGASSKLLLSVAKSGPLDVKLARESYFGEDVMLVSTVSGLPKDKMKDIKARLYEVYGFDNLVEFEPLWQKCLIAIGKGCQG